VIRVDIADHFDERLQALEEFMVTQDRDSAPSRIEDLHAEVLQVVDVIGAHPKIGRPADMLAARSVEGQRRLESVLKLAASAGLPELREYVLRAHVVLYAHSASYALMLSIRHQRELGYVNSTALI
jgi:hypothetical protein